MKIKRDLSSLEIRELAKELEAFNYSFLDKIGFNDLGFVMRLHSSEHGKINFIFNFPYVYLSNVRLSIESKGFAQYLKKFIDNFKIQRIYQLGSERILVFDLGQYKLVFELFYSGDIVFLQDDVVVRVFNKKGGSKKSIGEKYELLNQFSNIFDASFDVFNEKLNDSLVKSLARLIGGVYAEEICYRLGVDKNSKDYDPHKVYSAFMEFINEKPVYLYYENEAIFSVRNLTMFNSPKMFTSFSSMIAEIASVEEKDSELVKIENAIRIQKQGIEELKQKIALLESEIEKIYNNYNYYDTALKLVRESDKKNVDLSAFNIKSIDRANKWVEFND